MDRFNPYVLGEWFASDLERKRVEMRMSYAYIAETLDYSPSYVRSVFECRQEPRLWAALRLQAFINTEYDRYLTDLNPF